MSNDLQTLSEFLAKTEDMPRPPVRGLSYFEICGFPHRENVWSSMLAFFLDPEEAHGFSDLVLDSILALAKYGGPSVSNVEVSREHQTSGRGRLDLLIQTDTVVLGIENKVHAAVNNDLADYAASINGLAATNSRHALGLVLSLKGTAEGQASPFFHDVTYSDLALEIRSRLGERLRDGSTRYLPLLLEFLANIDRLTEDNTMDLELVEFIEQHEKEISALNERLQTFRADLRRQVEQVAAELDHESLGKPCTQYYYRPRMGLFDTLVYDISLEPGATIATDAVLRASGWEFHVFQREGARTYPLREALHDKGVRTHKKSDEPYKLVCEDVTVPFTADPAAVAAEVLNLLKLIVELPLQSL